MTYAPLALTHAVEHACPTAHDSFFTLSLCTKYCYVSHSVLPHKVIICCYPASLWSFTFGNIKSCRPVKIPAGVISCPTLLYVHLWLTVSGICPNIPRVWGNWSFSDLLLAGWSGYLLEWFSVYNPWSDETFQIYRFTDLQIYILFRVCFVGPTLCLLVHKSVKYKDIQFKTSNPRQNLRWN